MELEVGKKYRCRNGRLVQITHALDPKRDHKFYGYFADTNHGFLYCENGKTCREGADHPLDILEESQPT